MFLALFLTLTACAEAPIPPDDLPDQVWFRTRTESFNTDWYVVLREGRIWVKPNEHTGERDPGDWDAVGRTGLPEGLRLVRHGTPEEIVALSADGCHLHALSAQGNFYRGTDLRRNASRSFTWKDRWGWPMARGPGLTTEGVDALAWDVSDSHPSDVDHYEDIFGQEHSVGLGVAHQYRLDPDGLVIRYNDWWLPADWSRRICGPDRGTFEAVTLSASGSTLFLLGADGRMSTRLWDFDTAGENDLLTYSYLEEDVSGSVRGLPAEPWTEQPAVPEGRLTGRIAIYQDGEGNAARMLRVEAVRDDVAGVWEKPIEADTWDWTETGESAEGPFLPDSGTGHAGALEADPPDTALEGELTREDLDTALEVELADFNLFCSPAQVTLYWEGKPLSVDGEPVILELHHVHAMVKEERDRDYWRDGTAADVRAALLLPEDLWRVDRNDALEAVETLFEEREVINLRGDAWSDELDLTEISRGDGYQVPRSQKGRRNKLFHLVARP